MNPRHKKSLAGLRPNPQFTLSADGLQLTPFHGHLLPLAGLMKVTGVSQLIERKNKRELRKESAQQATKVAASQLADQERNLLFNLRTAFVQTLQQKAILNLALENLSYYDQFLKVSRDRLQADDISPLDLKRLERQRFLDVTHLE